MADNQLKIGQVEINPDKAEDKLVRVFVSRTSPAKEKVLGKLFGLIETRFENKLDQEFSDNLIKKIKNNYYQLGEEVEETSLENIFEQALKKTNGEIGDLVKKESGFDVKNFNAIIAVLKDQQLHFAPVGSAYIYLIHALEKDKYKMMDILETTKSVDEFPSTTKVFSNVVSGEIKEEDSLLIANNNFLDYLSLDKIKNIITSLPAGSAAEQLKSLLLEVDNNHIFGALTVKFGPATAKTKPTTDKPQTTVSPQSSMDGLIVTETSTEKLLNPSVGLNFGQFLKKIIGSFPNKSLAKKAYNKGSYGRSQSLLKVILRQLGKFLVMFGYLFKGIFNLISKPQNKEGKKNPLSQRLDNRVSQFNALPRNHKIMIVAALIFIIIFTQVIIVLSKRQTSKIEEQQYDKIISQVEEKHDAAEASLIYEEEDRARQLLLESRELVNSLPQNSRQRRKEFETLTAKTESLLERTKKVIKVENPQIIADFASVNLQHAKQILPFNNNLLSYNPANNSIYEIDLIEKRIKDLAATTSRVGRLQLGTIADDQSLLFYHTDHGLAKFNPSTNAINPVAVEFSGPKVKDLLTYNKRLYVLDSTNSQIYKHNNTTDGFAKGTAWLTSDINLNDAVSFTIDGYIYVLKDNGEILKFLKGQKQEFNVLPLEPEFNRPTKIHTEIDSDYLYILDPTNKRLVVLDKEGKLKAQYVSEQFNGLKDFLVKEQENKIYLLNNTQILEMPIKHRE